jgi:O-antigen/teichoic acid export membrane protein
MKLTLEKLLTDKFVRGTFILTAATFFAALFSYLVHPLLTRRLTIPEYGDYQALISFLTILVAVGGVVLTAFTKEFSLLSASAPEEIKSLRRRAASRLFYLGVVLFALVFLFANFLGELFNLSQPMTIIITALGLICIFPLMVNRALLTGRQYFSSLAFSNVLDAFCRLFLAVVLVVFWPFGLVGAALALGLSSLLPFIISLWQIKKTGLPQVARDFSGSFKSIWRYGFLVFWFMVLTQFFYNFDMLAVKSFFDPETAGLYGALLTIGRIIFFIGAAVPLVMFPVIAGLKQDESLRRYQVLGKSLVLMTALAIPPAAFIALFPQLSIKIVVGAKYLSIAPYLPTFTIVILLLTLLTVLAQYFLALAKRRSLIILTAAAIGEVVLLFLFHNNIWSVIYSLIFVFGIASLALLISIWSGYSKVKRNLVGVEIKR